jgi:quercetin dioxygenase-like cupin family protein
MTESEFSAHAKTEGYREPESRSLPTDKFVDTHAHQEDLLVLITAGSFVVGYGDDRHEFGVGDMCHVAPGIEHADQAGPQGASYVLAWRQPLS